MPLSAVDCVQPAIQHTRDQLFRPFRFGQWSRLALVGVLAAELNASGCNFNGINFPVSSHPHRTQGLFTAATPFAPFDPSHFDPSRIAQALGLIIAIGLVAMVLFFVFLYINSVFRFILFDSVLKKRCSISEGWGRWHRAGRRYFLWQIVFIIAEFLFLGVLIGVPLAIAAALGWFRDAGQHIARSVLGVILLVGLFLVFLLVAWTVQLLAKDFLVPIMALEDLDFADGWSRLTGLIRPEPGRYAVYLLLKIVLAIAAAIVFSIIALVPIVVIVAPAIAAVFAGHAAGLGWNVTTISLTVILGTLLLFFLIYAIAMISVPATVFFPAFSIYFFASRYPKLDALLAPPPPIVETPPVLETPPLIEPPPLPPSPEPIG
ncbi:MAG: hypothetical protein ABSG70_16115 [Terriglobales bacterium]